ncbi:DUF5677 domain-containing protein [Paenibacillus sp. GD4]|uniref:DUF5677 domain-containing protein n=1 Tax=Paenibacillus sp. GD4 TaxID=3068890 RepID=UPI0027965477|nr:DUF5677 domain-containing protein [Paenibacillus sp. GD4]MDQ1913289.1 DUF5677 domain-containing protein [Paenibacillus sp. GD4]
MAKPLQKEEIYERWEKELEATKDLPFAHVDKYRNLILLLQTNEILLADIRGRKTKKFNQLQMISRFITAHSYQLGAGAYHLTKAGFGSPALVLGRSILESLIDLSYLWLCKEINGDDVERNAWVDYYKVTRHSVLTHSEVYKKRRQSADLPYEELFKEKTVEKLNKDFSDFKSDYPHAGSKVNWARISSLLKRAQALDDTGKLQKGFPEKNITGFPNFSFEEEFIGIYKHTSEYVHGQSGSMESLWDTEGNSGSIIIGASDVNVEVAIGLVANYLLVFSYIFAHINRLDLTFITDELNRHGFIVPAQE